MATPQTRRPESDSRNRVAYNIQSLQDAQAFLRQAGVSTVGLRVLDCSAEFNTVLGSLGHAQPGWTHAPFILQVPDETLAILMRHVRGETPGHDTEAAYIHHSNLILIRESAAPSRWGELSGIITKEDAPECALNDTICHEITHYLSFIGGGWYAIFRVGRRGDVQSEIPHWMQEGIVESIIGHLNQVWQEIAYPEETLVSIMLENVAGDHAITREALMSGDFRRLQQAVDQRLGRGTLAILMGTARTEDGERITNGSEALAFLLTRINERCPEILNDSAFNHDVRVARAVTTIVRYIMPNRQTDDYSVHIVSGEER